VQPASGTGEPMPTLRSSQVHVWYYHLDGPPAADDDDGRCLDAGERQRADRFLRERDGRRFRAAHCAFRHLVAGYLGCAPAAVLITRECPHCGDSKHGKPAVADPSGRRIEVNATHSDALGALAVALPPVQVGVDVEWRRPDVNWAGILPDATAAEPPGDGFEQWTRLEAVAKAAGTGIVRMPRLAPAGDGDWASATFTGGAAEWQVRGLSAPPGYTAALAVSAVPAAGVEVRWRR
jgi:4'-phosphopantetheinyl transferase